MSLSIRVDDEIQLKFILPSHAEELSAVIDANRSHLAKWLPWATDGYDLAGVRAWINSVTEAFGKCTELALAICHHDKIVGGTGWTSWKNVDNAAWQMKMCSADIGYWLARDSEGLGIVTRSTRSLIDYAFHEVGMHRISIRAEPDNKRSWSIPERLGFQFEGTQRHVCYWKDRWVDHKCYAMLKENWPSG